MKDEKMMSYKVESEKDTSEDFSSGRLLRDIKDISRALNLHKTSLKDLLSPSGHQFKSLDNSPVSNSKSNVILEDLLSKDKKSSIWNWKPLKALTNLGNHRFNCCFFLHVHAIEGLPSNFNDLSLCVNWKRKDEVLRTCPARVCQGMAEFEETLIHRCSVYGNKNGPQNSAKYEPKLFLLNASVIGAPTLDIGKHWVDLTRLFPLTLEELEKEKRTSGKWTTSFKLTGKAKGATMKVSFGFSLLWGKLMEPYRFVEVPESLKGNGPTALDNLKLEDCGQISMSGMLRGLDRVPKNSSTLSRVRSRSMDIRIIDEIFPKGGSKFAHSISFLYHKLKEEKLGNSNEFDFFDGHTEPLKSKSEHLLQLTGENNVCDDTEFTVSERETELSLKEEIKLEEDDNPRSDHSVVETIDIAEIFKDIGTACDVNTDFQSKLEVHGDNMDRSVIEDSKHTENDICCEDSTAEELESDFNHFLTPGSAVFGSSPDTGKFDRQESYVKRTSSLKKGMVRSLSLDDLIESVANDFLNMLGIKQYLQDETSDNGPESPKERLLRQFEEESLALGNSIFDFKTTEIEQLEYNDVAATCRGRVACSDDFDLSLAIQEAEGQGMVTQSLRSKRNKELENLETEALTKEWGLDEKDFHHSPCISSGGFGSPIYLHPGVPSRIPHLEKD